MRLVTSGFWPKKSSKTTRIEIAAGPARSAVPWEILWNPLDVKPIAGRAACFVRSGFAPAALPSPNVFGAIRILLVISRPAGILDAPFRSVAARLLDRVGNEPRFPFRGPAPAHIRSLSIGLAICRRAGATLQRGPFRRPRRT